MISFEPQVGKVQTGQISEGFAVIISKIILLFGRGLSPHIPKA